MRVPTLRKVAQSLEQLLKDLLDGQPRIERVSARVKAIDRFVDKALRVDPASTTYKYNDPPTEIQDQIGARIIVYYRSDIDVATSSVMRELREIESMRMEPA